MKNKYPIIIDTDPGHDDALAMILMCKSELFDIKAITTVAGNSTIERTTNNARYILDLLGSDIDLYDGSGEPLVRELIQANVHGESGLDGADVTKDVKLNNDAVDRIISIIKSSSEKVTILTLGPLTNIAKAFIKEPCLPGMIKKIVMMGGAISVPGNKNRVAEFNIFVDPDAADVVFNASVEKVLVPLDSTNDIFLTARDFKKIQNEKLSNTIMKMMKPYIKNIKKFEGVSGALMYDPLAAYYLINPKAYRVSFMDIRVETASNLTRGMTVADRTRWGAKIPNVRVVTSIKGNLFKRDFIKILNR